MGFPTPKTPSIFYHNNIYTCITFPLQEHHVPYLAISKIMILYETLKRVSKTFPTVTIVDFGLLHTLDVLTLHAETVQGRQTQMFDNTYSCNYFS